MRTLRLAAVLSALFWIALVPRRIDAQRSERRALTLEHGSLVARASRDVVWSSGDGNVFVAVRAHVHRVHLTLTSAHGRVVHEFERPTFGSGALFVELASWHPEALALRIYETAPSLGWPRFTACVRAVARGGRLRITGARERGTELGCD